MIFIFLFTIYFKRLLFGRLVSLLHIFQEFSLGKAKNCRLKYIAHVKKNIFTWQLKTHAVLSSATRNISNSASKSPTVGAFSSIIGILNTGYGCYFFLIIVSFLKKRTMGHNERFTCFVEKQKTIIFEKYLPINLTFMTINFNFISGSLWITCLKCFFLSREITSIFSNLSNFLPKNVFCLKKVVNDRYDR